MLLVQVLTFSSIHTVAPLTVALLAAAAKKSGSSFTLIFIVLLFVVGYMFLIRPQRQRRQRQLQVSKQIEVAPGVIIEVVRGAVSRHVDEAVDGGHDPGHGQGSDRPLR